MAETIKGINVVIGSDTSGLSKALGDVNKKARDIQSELKQVEKLLQLDPSNTELVAQKQKLLGEAIANSREKLDRLRSVQEQVNRLFAKGDISEGQYRAFQREVINAEQGLKGFEEKLKTSGSSAEQAGEKIQNMGHHMHGAAEQAGGLMGKLTDMHTQMNLMFGGMALTSAITAPFVAFGKAAADASIGFEEAFSGVRKTVDATEEEFEQMESNFLEMSKSMPVAANEFAKIGEMAGQLGIEGVDNITEFTETISKLAVSTNMTSDRAAEDLARFANIMQMPISNIDELGSTIVELGNKMAATETDISEMSLRIAGAGKQVGLTEPQIAGFAAALSSVGIEAEAGGSAISKVFMELANASASGGKNLESFAKVAGMSSDQFKAAFEKDAAGATVEFIKGLEGIKESGGNVFGVLEQLGINEIRVRDALLRTAGAGDLLSQSLDTANIAWQENSALNEEAAKKFDTTGSKLQIMKNNFDLLAKTFGDTLAPILTPIVQGITGLLQGLQGMPEPIQLIVFSLGGLLAAIGPLMLLLSGIGASMTGLTSIMGLFGGSVTAAGGAVAGGGGFAAALTALTGPIGIAVAAIAALVAAVVVAYKHSEEFRNIVNDVFAQIQEIISAVMTAISDFIKEKIDAILQWWTENGEAIKAATQIVWDLIKIIFESVLPVIKSIIEGTFNAIKTIIETVWNVIKDIISGTLDIIMGVISVFANLLTGNWEGLWDGLTQVLKGAKTIITGVVDGLIEGIINLFSGLVVSMLDIGKNIIRGLIDGIKSMIGKLKDVISNIADTVTEGISDALGINSPSRVLMEIGEYTGEGFILGLKSTIGEISKQSRAMANAVNPNVSAMNNPNVSAGAAGENPGNVVINFYPQQMTESELDKAFSYVNKRLGMAL